MSNNRPPPLTPDLNREGPDLLWEQLVAIFRQRVLSGVWPPHYKLDAEVELAHEFRVSRGTLKKALSCLREEGLLVQVHGRGTFIAAPKEDLPLAQELVTLSELFYKDSPTHVDVLISETCSGPERTRSLLGLAPENGDLFHLRRRFYLGTEATALTDNYVRLDRCPDLPTKDFLHVPLFEMLEREFGLSILWGQRTFGAVTSTDIADLLGVDAATPLLYVEQIVHTAASPLEYSDIWIDGRKARAPVILRGRH